MGFTSSRPFFARHEFLIRRLHSLTGLVPIGAFMTVHLLTNMTVLAGGPAMFQKAVYQIHGFGPFLPIVEWTLIFLPILFHGLLGVAIIRGGLPNSGVYPYAPNIRYTLQRATAIIALLFIVYHVFHMHGWFHFELWHEKIVKPFGGAQFKPYNAVTTLAAAMQGVVIQAIYAVGVLACVFHLANGIWSMGITWGVWTSRTAQHRASLACAVLGIALALVGMGALIGPFTVDAEVARRIEDKMFLARITAGDIGEDEAAHKRSPAIYPAALPRDTQIGPTK